MNRLIRCIPTCRSSLGGRSPTNIEHYMFDAALLMVTDRYTVHIRYLHTTSHICQVLSPYLSSPPVLKVLVNILLHYELPNGFIVAICCGICASQSLQDEQVSGRQVVQPDKSTNWSMPVYIGLYLPFRAVVIQMDLAEPELCAKCF